MLEFEMGTLLIFNSDPGSDSQSLSGCAAGAGTEDEGIPPGVCRMGAQGLAVTIDIGQRTIHPVDKKDVGHRLALVALEMVYHEKENGTGPLYLSSQIDGDHVVVKFDHIGSGLTLGKGMDALGGFAIAGADRKFVAADAKIVGDTVVARSDAVPRPAAVRYLWANNPTASLFNNDGLPASPFRTDDWPIATQDAR